MYVQPTILSRIDISRQSTPMTEFTRREIIVSQKPIVHRSVLKKQIKNGYKSSIYPKTLFCIQRAGVVYSVFSFDNPDKLSIKRSILHTIHLILFLIQNKSRGKLFENVDKNVNS